MPEFIRNAYLRGSVADMGLGIPGLLDPPPVRLGLSMPPCNLCRTPLISHAGVLCSIPAGGGK